MLTSVMHSGSLWYHTVVKRLKKWRHFLLVWIRN